MNLINYSLRSLTSISLQLDSSDFTLQSESLDPLDSELESLVLS